MNIVGERTAAQGTAYLLICEVAQREAGEDLEMAQRGLLPLHVGNGGAVAVGQRIKIGALDWHRVYGDALRERHHVGTASRRDRVFRLSGVRQTECRRTASH